MSGGGVGYPFRLTGSTPCFTLGGTPLLGTKTKNYHLLGFLTNKKCQLFINKNIFLPVTQIDYQIEYISLIPYI